jgi:hypothetical protein
MGDHGKGHWAAAVIFSVVIAATACASDNEVNKDTTASVFPDRRDLTVGVFSAQRTNPATLGFDRTAKNELTVPIFPAVWAGWWSNRLAVTPYFDMADSGKLADYINVMLDRSFNTVGLDPGQASKKIMNDVADGISVCARTRTTSLALTTRLGSIAVHSSFDAQVDIPRGFFALIFGDDQGLAPGNRIDFKELKAEAIAYSTISAAYGRQFSSPLLKQFVKRLSHGFFDFTDASWGLGVDYIIGHALVKEKTLE